MWYTKPINEVEEQLRTNRQTGLDEKEAQMRLQKSGPNKLADQKKESIIKKFLLQFNDFMIIILIFASIISAIIAYVEGTGDYIDSIIIIAIVVFNALMGLIQEQKAEKSLEALKNMTAPFAKVKRNSKWQNIPATNIVIGDIIELEAGNYVPADCRLISSSDLKIDESSLTGETIPVLKNAKKQLQENISDGDMVNMAFYSSIVVNGHGQAIVTDIGMNTKVGKIANMIISDTTPETPIQKKLAEVGKTLGIVCLFICVAIFIIGLIKNIPPIEMFMTSVGLAVAAIPEGLPAIVTIMLSIGVTKMAKQNSIIRKLPAVETLGSSSVICSDKTGTLTQNKMQVTTIFSSSSIASLNNLSKYKKSTLPTSDKMALELACMCTDSDVIYENREYIVSGEATETAIVNAALELDINKNRLYNLKPKIADIPFDSDRKLMTTIHQDGDKIIAITKGAPDVFIQRCTHFFDGSSVVPLTLLKKADIEKANEYMAKNALRVIAVGYRSLEALPNSINSNDIENNLIFVGLLGMIDPPRPGVKEAIATCKKLA